MTPSGFALSHIDRLIEQRLVGDDTSGLDAAGCGQHKFWLRIVDARRKLLGRETTEYDGMHGADARAGKHREECFRDHRHIEKDAVALRDAVRDKHRSERRDFVFQLTVGDRAFRIRYGAVVVDRDLVFAFAVGVSIHGVKAHVAKCVGKPAAINAGLCIEDAVG